MHLKELIKTILKNITLVVFSEFVLKVGDSGQILREKGTSLENKCQNMLHKLSLDANHTAIYYWLV